MCDFCKTIYPDEDFADIAFRTGKYSKYHHNNSSVNLDAFITVDEDNDYHICTVPEDDPYETGWVLRIIFCPYCGRKLKDKEE